MAALCAIPIIIYYSEIVFKKELIKGALNEHRENL